MTERFRLSGNNITGEVLAEYLRAQPELEGVPVYEGTPLWAREDIEAVMCNGCESESHHHDDQTDAAVYGAVRLGGTQFHRSGIEWGSNTRWRLPHYQREYHPGLSPDTHTMQFDLERTETCWRDDCGAESDPESETGLCIGCRTELRSRWSE